MIAGLEFLKSWRYWALFIGSTSAVTLGSAAVHIALVTYLPAIAVEPDPFYSLLGGFAILCLAIGLQSIIYRHKEQEPCYPDEYRELLSLFIAFAAMFITVAEWAAVHWLIVKPIVPGAPGGGVYALFVVMFALSFGRWIAMLEWEAMVDAGGDAGRSATPDSP